MNNEFSGVIGFWRGPAPRYFVTVPAEQGADLKAISGFVTYGWGVIPVRTRIEREFDPDAIRRLRASTGRDIAVAGPELAGQAMRAGLVDEFHLLVCPVIVGGGTRSLPGRCTARPEPARGTPLRQRRGCAAPCAFNRSTHARLRSRSKLCRMTRSIRGKTETQLRSC